MSAPSNDNFANAIAIGGQSGYLSGSNKGATIEGWEKFNEGSFSCMVSSSCNASSVWYKWDAGLVVDGEFSGTPAPLVYFTTAYVPELNTPSPISPHKLTVYLGNPTDTGSLEEVVYLPAAGYTTRYALASDVSYIAFDPNAEGQLGEPTPNGIFYVRLDAATFSGSQGDFALSWGDYVPNRLYQCETCPTGFDTSFICIDQVQITNVNIQEQTLYFGYDGGAHTTASYGPGIFKMLFCGNCFYCQTNGTSLTANYQVATPPDLGGPDLRAQWDLPSGRVKATFSDLPGALYSSQEACMAGFSCMNRTLTLDIPSALAVYLYDDPYEDNRLDFYTSGPNSGSARYPTYALYQMHQDLEFGSCCVHWDRLDLTQAPTATATFTINNFNSNEWTNCTASLDTNSNLTFCAPTHFAITASQPTTFDVHFSASTSNISTTLRIKHKYFDSEFDYPINLAPILTVVQDPGLVYIAGGGCAIGDGIHRSKQTAYKVRNDGYWYVNATASVTMHPDIGHYDDTCTLQTGMFSTYNIFAGCSGGTPTAYFNPYPSNSTVQLTMSVIESTHTYAFIQIPMFVPGV